MANISTKELEERSKKIFNALGLKDLDIKISRSDNGKTTTEHVHVDKDGAKTECSSGASASESTSKAFKTLGEWLAGVKTYDQMLDSFKKQFEDRCKDKFGASSFLNMENLTKEIDNQAANFFKDPLFGTITKSLRDVGINITQDDINTAAEQLKKKWFPAYTNNKTCDKKDTCDSKCECKKEEDISAKPSSGVSKAAKLREMIRKDEEAEAANERLKSDIIEKIQNAISSKSFKTFDNPSSGEKNAGIEVTVMQNHAGDPSEVRKIYEQAGSFITSDYGFSSCHLLTLGPSEIKSPYHWKFRFWF